MEGERLGPYRIERALGAGGMGNVYAAIAVERRAAVAEGTRVALKVVHPHLLESPGFFKRFLRELQIGKTVEHANVVRTYDGDSLLVDGTRRDFLVMEYVEGQTLRDLLHELGRVPEELCLHIATEVANGLAAIHESGVVHRDVKPDNVLITSEHVVKIMDLGVAWPQAAALRLSQTGAFVGSIHYAAPEQFARTDQTIDGRTDLHALGVVLYELATGAHPFMADTFGAVMQRILSESPRRVGDMNPQVSAYFEEVVHCLLAKEAAERFPDARTLLGVLREGEHSEWWKARATAIRNTTRRPLRRIRIPRETDVFGRDDELAQLREVYDQTREGHGQVVLIEGEAGIGKSRLVDEFVRRLQREGDDVNFLFGSYPPGGAATSSGAFATAFREEFGDEGARQVLQRSPALATAFDAMLRGDVTPDGADLLTRDSLATCFVESARALAAVRSTIILIDDLHFAPLDALSMFAAVAMAVPGHRVMLVGAMRPGTAETWRSHVTRLEHTTQLSVGRLGPKDLGALLVAAFESRHLADELGHRIAMKSDGNPFFAFEIIRGLRDADLISRNERGSWVSTRRIDEIEIPSSVLDLVNARVAELTQEERDVIDVASCCGFEFDPLLVGETVGIARIPVLKLLSHIERKNRLVRSAGRRFVFDHHQIREALYQGLPELLREEYHAALGAHLERRSGAADAVPETIDPTLSARLCVHFQKGRQGERALRYLRGAAIHCHRRCRPGEAVALLEHALAQSGLIEGPERAAILLELSDPLDLLGRRERQEECAREIGQIAEVLDDDGLRASGAIALGCMYASTAQPALAEAEFRRALALAVARDDGSQQSRATGKLSVVLLALARPDEAREFALRSIEVSRRIGSRQGEAAALGNLGNVLAALGQMDAAREMYEEARDLHRAIGGRNGEAVATGNLGMILFSQGHLERTREHYEQQLLTCREIGDRALEALATGNLGVVLYCQGQLDEAEEHYERTIALSREIGDRHREALFLSNLGVLDAELDRDDRARANLVHSWSLLEKAGLWQVAQWNLPALVDLELRAGRVRTAEAVLRDRLALAREHHDGGGIALALVTATRIPDADLPDAGVEAAEQAFAQDSHRLESRARMEALMRLYESTAKTTYLDEARRLLDASMADEPVDIRASMRANLRVNREIIAAAD